MTNRQDTILTPWVNSVPQTTEETIVDNLPVTTSRIIAKLFNKKHKDVLHDIETLNYSNDIPPLYFQPTRYADKKKRIRPAYDITKNGFAILVASYDPVTTRKFRITCTNLFNRTETQISAEINLQTWGLKYQNEVLKTQNETLKTQNETLKTQNETTLQLVTRSKTQNETLKTQNEMLKTQVRNALQLITRRRNKIAEINPQTEYANTDYQHPRFQTLIRWLFLKPLWNPSGNTLMPRKIEHGILPPSYTIPKY